MSSPIIKKLFQCTILMLVMNGCVRVNTNPQPDFQQIQEDITKRTGQNAYWDSCLDDCVVPVSVEEILQKELTEEFVVQIALLNNQNLQAAYESLGIAKAQLAQAGLLTNPIFSLSYRFSTKTNVTDLIDISLFQNFLEILLIPLKRRMADAELEATKARILTQILDVIAQTKIAFYTLKAAKEIWELKKQILLAAELSYEAAQKLFEVGNVRDLDLSIEQSMYEQAKLEVASWEIAVLEERERLNVLMGLWGRQIKWEISPGLPAIPAEECDFKNIENDAIENSIDLKVAYKELLATVAGFGIDTSRLVFPQFNLGPSSERDESVWYVGPAFSLAIPLFDFGHAISAKAHATIMQQWNQYIALAIEIRSKARSSRFFLLNAFRQSQYLEKIIVPLAEQITYSTFLQHNAMQMGIFDLLSAKQREFERKIQHLQMQRDYWVFKVRIQTLLYGHVIEAQSSIMPLRRYSE